MSEQGFAVDTSETVIDTRLSKEEISQALDEVHRISQLDFPITDWSVESIKVTNNEWHRQKIPGERWRSVLVIQQVGKTIIVHAILARDDNTYKVVERLYEAAQSED